MVGRRAGQEAARFAACATPAGSAAIPGRIEHEVVSSHGSPELDLTDLERSLKATTWYDIGVEREARGLERALRQLRRWIGYALDVEQRDRGGWELQNMLTIALAMARQALVRTESRGAHHRSDYPDPKAQWARRHSHIDLGRLAEQPE